MPKIAKDSPYYQRLAAEIARADIPAVRDAHRKSGTSDTAYRWGMFWAAHDRALREARDAHGPYAESPLRLANEYTDTHLDTALRSLVPSLSE